MLNGTKHNKHPPYATKIDKILAMFNFLKRHDTHNSLFYHTDMHCHLLPGVDHGAPDIDSAINLVQDEIDMGITHIIATSHVTECTFENTPASLLQAGKSLTDAIKEKQLNVDLKISAEYRMDDFFLSQFKQNMLLPLPNKHLLVENSFQQERMDIDEIIFDLQSADFTLILAHPERYHRYYTHDRYRYLYGLDIRFQVNILSFTGYFGTGALNTAKWLLHNDMIDFLGSDIHNDTHSKLIKDFLKTKEYRKLAEQLEKRLLNDSAFI